jgi:hypothetical protein
MFKKNCTVDPAAAQRSGRVRVEARSFSAQHRAMIAWSTHPRQLVDALLDRRVPREEREAFLEAILAAKGVPVLLDIRTELRRRLEAL